MADAALRNGHDDVPAEQGEGMGKKSLSSYMQDDKQYYVPEIFDCMSTKAAEINGFKMVMISSSDFSCASTGIPDLKLLTVDEYASMTERIT